jgi:hypothetical protein
MYLVITGNPVNGFTFIGPFPVTPDAVEWAETYVSEEDWWISEITATDTFEAT